MAIFQEGKRITVLELQKIGLKKSLEKLERSHKLVHPKRIENLLQGLYFGSRTPPSFFKSSWLGKSFLGSLKKRPDFSPKLWVFLGFERNEWPLNSMNLKTPKALSIFSSFWEARIHFPFPRKPKGTLLFLWALLDQFFFSNYIFQILKDMG